LLFKIKYLTKNATVFPVPVLALARTSLPRNKICKSYDRMDKGANISHIVGEFRINYYTRTFNSLAVKGYTLEVGTSE